MGRKNARANAHIQEKRATAGVGLPSPAPGPEPAPAGEGGRHSGWRLAATLWAIVFLFLTALMVFDLVVSLVR